MDQFAQLCVNFPYTCAFLLTLYVIVPLLRLEYYVLSTNNNCSCSVCAVLVSTDLYSLHMYLQTVLLWTLWVALWSPVLSSNVQPLSSARVGFEWKWLYPGFRSEATVCRTGEFKLQTGDTKVRQFKMALHKFFLLVVVVVLLLLIFCHTGELITCYNGTCQRVGYIRQQYLWKVVQERTTSVLATSFWFTDTCGERRVACLVQSHNRRASVALIPEKCNAGCDRHLSEHTVHFSLLHMGLRNCRWVRVSMLVLVLWLICVQ